MIHRKIKCIISCEEFGGGGGDKKNDVYVFLTGGGERYIIRKVGG